MVSIQRLHSEKEKRNEEYLVLRNGKARRSMSKLLESKSWIVETYYRKFDVKGISITVRFTVRRRVNKWFWNILKTDTIFFKNDYTDERAEHINLMFGNKEARKLYLEIEIEMLKLKLRHLR